MRRWVLAAVGVFFVAWTPLSAAGPTQRSSWAQAQIRVVAAHGLLGGDPAAFRPDDPLTAGELADLVAGLTAKPAPAPADPTTAVTITQLDAALVRGEGLGPAAARFTSGLRFSGLTPPARLGTEAVARLLGLRPDHPRSQEYLEPAPTSIATRAEAAYSVARILRWQGPEKQYVQSLAATFSPELVGGWQQTILQEAVSLIGYPYVWAGTSEKAQAPLGTTVPGGFDCSGLVWRVYKLAGYSVGTPLADTVRGRSTYAMSGEVPPARRIAYAGIQPADVLFFGPRGPRSRPAQIDHTGIYVGGGWMIDSGSAGVHLSPISTGYWAARFAWARRPLAEAGLE